MSICFNFQFSKPLIYVCRSFLSWFRKDILELIFANRSTCLFHWSKRRKKNCNKAWNCTIWCLLRIKLIGEVGVIILSILLISRVPVSRALNLRRDTPDLIQIKNTPVHVGSIFLELTPRRIKARGIWTPVKTIIAQQRRTWHILNDSRSWRKRRKK